MSVIHCGPKRLALVNLQVPSETWTGETSELPINDEGVKQWCSLALHERWTGNSYPLRIVRSGTKEGVRVWMQGVVLEKLLRDEGSTGLGMDGEVEPWLACQGIRLGAGWSEWDSGFKKQLIVLRKLVNVVFVKLGLPPLDTPLPQTLFLRHPTEEWGGSPIEIQSVNEQGDMCSCGKGDIARGDVVDIRVVPQIALVVGRDGLPRTSVFFGWDKVVKIRDRARMLSSGSGGLWLSTEWSNDSHLGSRGTAEIDIDQSTLPEHMIATVLEHNSDSGRTMLAESIDDQYQLKSRCIAGRDAGAGYRRYSGEHDTSV